MVQIERGFQRGHISIVDEIRWSFIAGWETGVVSQATGPIVFRKVWKNLIQFAKDLQLEGLQAEIQRTLQQILI